MIEVGKKYICKNGVVVALISCSSFIAVTAVHKNENLVSTAMDEEWNTFGKANDCEFDIECESSTY